MIRYFERSCTEFISLLNVHTMHDSRTFFNMRRRYQSYYGEVSDDDDLGLRARRLRGHMAPMGRYQSYHGDISLWAS